MHHETLAAIGTHGTELRLRLVQRQDRFFHELIVPRGSDVLIPALLSVEGTGDDPWPSSPPLQSLRVETLAPGRRAALLVGMAGCSHWSASIEAVEGRAAFEFDLACRTSDPAAQARSTYELIGNTAIGQSAPEQVELHCPGGTITIAIDSATGGQCRFDGGRVSILPHAGESSALRTLRWKYVLELRP